MLARWVFTVWGAWLGALGLAAALTASQIWNPTRSSRSACRS